MKNVGPEAVANEIKKMGITSDIPVVPSICLGTFDASIYDMVGAYSVFANKGVWTQPNFITRIEDKNGIVLFESKPIIKVAMSEEVAYVMTRMLRGVVANGTGSRLSYKYKVNTPIGGKTGTTQNNSDGWFMAISPDLVAGIWTGCEDRAFHFISTRLGEGANSALPIYAGFMKRVYADPSISISRQDFEAPAGGTNIVYDCTQYQQPQTEQEATETEKRLGF
jgi:penicillin-binding protein 1A